MAHFNCINDNLGDALFGAGGTVDDLATMVNGFDEAD